MRDVGLAVELLETRHVRDAFKAMPVKTDRKDTRGIAQLMRLGWLLETKNHDVEMSLRGVLRGFGLKVPCGALQVGAAQEVRALLTARKPLGPEIEGASRSRSTSRARSTSPVASPGSETAACAPHCTRQPTTF
jgi:hypothetical protein